MKITLVYPDVLLHRPDWTGYFYSGIGSISAVLKEAGHKVSFIHIVQPIQKHEFLSRIKESEPDLIGFSTTSHMFPLVKIFASWLKEDGLNITTICGGIHPTIAPEKTIQAEGIDMICRGEGEAAIVELCNKLEKNEDVSQIENIWVKKEGQIFKNPLRPLRKDLDTLPFPDRSIFNYESLYAEREGRGSFLVGRGCPYNCTYCCNHLLRKIYGTEGKRIRFRSVENVIAEIKQALTDYPSITSLIFDDDILFLNKKWSEKFTQKYRSEINLPFTCNARANLIDKFRVDLLKRAGCVHVKFGLESGNEEISNKILNRQLKNKQIIEAFSLCKKAGLLTESFNMVAIPKETPEAILDTIKLNAKIDVDTLQVTIFQPYQGTKLAEFCEKEYGLESDDLASDFFSPSILNLESVKPAQALMFRDYFKVFVGYYKFLRKLPEWLADMATKASDSVLCFYPTAKLLNAVYIPLNYIYRRILVWKVRNKKPLYKNKFIAAKHNASWQMKR